MVAKINRGSSLFGALAAHPATAALDPEDGAKIETLTARLNTAEAERLKKRRRDPQKRRGEKQEVVSPVLPETNPLPWRFTQGREKNRRSRRGGHPSLASFLRIRLKVSGVMPRYDAISRSGTSFTMSGACANRSR